MARIIAAVALFACLAVALAADPLAEQSPSPATPAVKAKEGKDLQTANSFYGGYGLGGYGLGYGNGGV
jgi:hypothetical protein